LLIFLVMVIDSRFERYTSLGGLFKIFLATSDNRELSNVTPKILKTTVKPKKSLHSMETFLDD